MLLSFLLIIKYKSMKCYGSYCNVTLEEGVKMLPKTQTVLNKRRRPSRNSKPMFFIFGRSDTKTARNQPRTLLQQKKTLQKLPFGVFNNRPSKIKILKKRDQKSFDSRGHSNLFKYANKA